jgi:hypothetical protein
MLVSMRACCALGGLARLLVWGVTTSFLVGHAGAQVLRDPPTQSGPPHYDDSFTEPVTIAGVSIGLRDIPLGDDPDWFVDLGGSRHGGVPARRSRRTSPEAAIVTGPARLAQLSAVPQEQLLHPGEY